MKRLFSAISASLLRVFKVGILKLIYTLLFLMSSYTYAQVVAQVDVSRVLLGESFRLTLILDSADSQSFPNLTSLQTDFKILGTERSTNYSIINGQTSSSSQWGIILMPKRAGVLSIPPIKVGTKYSKAMTIDVITENLTTNPPPSQQAVDKPKNVMLIASVSNEHPYINEQVIYTVKLYNSQRLLDAAYHPPAIDNALMVSLGDERRYQVSENGQQYAVEELQYAIFPQKSGELKVTPPQFSALLYGVVPEQVSIQADPVILKVKSVPSTAKGKDWLPAKQITLSDTYDKATRSLNQGSTLVRTVTLKAVGLPAQLLPNLSFDNKNASFNTYMDKPVETNKLEKNDLVGIKTLKVTYLLNKSGKMALPALTLTWFNTTTGKEQTTSLPELALHVNPIQDEALITPDQTSESQTSVKQIQPPSKLEGNNSLAWWVAGGFAIAWVLTLIGKRPRKAPIPKQIKIKKTSPLKALEKACLANDPAAAKEALLHWAKVQWPNTSLLNLSDISQLLSDENLQYQIEHLSKALYQTSLSAWQGAELWFAVKAYKGKRASKETKKDVLPPINPNV